MNFKLCLGRAFRAVWPPKIASLVALTTLGATASVADAQTSTGAGSKHDYSTTIDEIIVTARKISEDVQKVPESITTFSAEQIAQAQIHSVDDFIALRIIKVCFQQLHVLLGLVILLLEKTLPVVLIPHRFGLALVSGHARLNVSFRFCAKDFASSDVVSCGVAIPLTESRMCA